MLAPDLLHEYELGNFKAVLTHLLRILAYFKADKISEFDER